MIPGLASLVFIPFLSIGLVHLIWAFGGKYPMQSRERLARAMIGTRGVTRMPPRPLTFLFALLSFAAGILALSLSDPGAGPGVVAAGAVLTLALALRGFAGYTRLWARWRPEEPFRAMDRKVYSPLAFVLAAGFLFLVLWRYV